MAQEKVIWSEIARNGGIMKHPEWTKLGSIHKGYIELLESLRKQIIDGTF